MESNLKTRGKDRRRLSEAALFSASGVYVLGLRWVWGFGGFGGFCRAGSGGSGLRVWSFFVGDQLHPRPTYPRDQAADPAWRFMGSYTSPDMGLFCSYYKHPLLTLNPKPRTLDHEP